MANVCPDYKEKAAEKDLLDQPRKLLDQNRSALMF